MAVGNDSHFIITIPSYAIIYILYAFSLASIIDEGK